MTTEATVSVESKFGLNLKKYRTRAKLTQEQLAQKVHLVTSYVSMLERGQRSPPLATIARLADALGTTPSKLVA